MRKEKKKFENEDSVNLPDVNAILSSKFNAPFKVICNLGPTVFDIFRFAGYRNEKERGKGVFAHSQSFC